MVTKDTKSYTDADHDHDSADYEKRTKWVVYLTAATMVVEIMFGYWTNSMALLADGYHMASHVFALGLAWLTYVVARKYAQTSTYSFNKKKLLDLSGFMSAMILQIIAIMMAVQAVDRLLSPLPIRFEEAIIVSVIGLVVNVLSALLLGHGSGSHDHTMRSAYLHVIADGLTSVTAIIALTAGLYYQIYSLDSFSGIISSLVITKWAVSLMIQSGKELVDFTKNPL